MSNSPRTIPSDALGQVSAISTIRDRIEQRTSLSTSLPNIQPFTVDFTALEYVGSFDHNLMCAICHSPFVHPMKIGCGHIFCETCIAQALYHQNTENQTCPTCRAKTNEFSVVPVPKILEQILEELSVKCPLSGKGCTSEIPRGSVQDHIGQYCEYVEVECPFNKECSEPLQRKYLWQDRWENRCLHNFVQCSTCGDMVMEIELASHTAKHDNLREIVCPGCKTKLRHQDLEKHNTTCPEAIISCKAASYGCDFTSNRTSMAQHISTCPLAKLTPFLQLQNDRLAAHEAALKHLRYKNSLLEISLHHLQRKLNLSSDLFDRPTGNRAFLGTLRNPPFDSPAHHLLCLHESLRDEVGRVAAAVSELDARASVTIVNEGLRVKEELSYTNAAVEGMRMELNWLVSSRLQALQHSQPQEQQQQQQRAAVCKRGNQQEGPVDDVLGLEDLMELWPRPKQSSDSIRQEPKL